MFGVRLGDELEQRLTAVARDQGRRKRDFARDTLPVAADGLVDSEVESDRLQAICRERIGCGVGVASDHTMTPVDQAPPHWFHL